MNRTEGEWTAFRDELVDLSNEGDHEWMDYQDVKEMISEAYNKGLSPQLIVSCRAAAASHEEFAAQLDVLVAKSKIRLLMIDDEKALMNLVKLSLEKTGRFEVATEDQSVKWREALEKYRPQLLILDMVMPQVDGQEIITALRSDPETEHLPIIVLTAILQNSDTAAVNKDGTLFLAKPLSIKALIHCIDEHLRRHR